MCVCVCVCVCSAQYGCCWQFLNFVVSWYVAQVLSEWLWNDSICPCYFWYQFCFHIPWDVLNFCWGLYILKSSQLLSWSHLSPGIATSINKHIPCLLLRIIIIIITTTTTTTIVMLVSVLIMDYYYYYYYYYYCYASVCS